MELPEAVRARIRREFPEDEQVGLVALLSSYGTETHHRERERVLLDILTLAKGDRQHVVELVARAKEDFRDIIFWAEHPGESRLDTPERMQAMNDMLRAFGVNWRVTDTEDG